MLNNKKEREILAFGAAMLLVLYIIDLFVDIRNMNGISGILRNLAEMCLGVGILYLCIKTYRSKEQLYKKDYLTGGYNREGFLEAVKERLQSETGTIVYLDVENFRGINQKLGEEKANEILCCIHTILQKTVGNDGVVCRNSTDQFLLYYKKTQEEVKHLLAKQISFIQDAVLDTAMNFYVGAYGLGNAEELLNGVDNAVYMSRKKEIRNTCQFYNAEVEQKIQKEKKLLFWFDTAIQNQELQIYLQPQVPLNQTKTIQAEALIRWNKPEVGMIYPNEFIPLLEKSSRIDQLDMYVFEQVCQIVAGWIANQRPVIEVSVNISREHLKHVGVTIWKEYCKIKQKYQIPDGVLKLELTENTMLELPELSSAEEIINGFHSCGLKVALDDFGFAYSSLILLKEFDIDILKLDRAFFIDENKKSQKIVSSMIQLAHELDMTVVAEGIEKPEQVEELNGMKCDYIQGYVYSKPMPVADFEEWVVKYNKR